jgi:hypothetical protein
MPDKLYRDDVTPRQAAERRRAFAELMRAAGRAVDQQGRRESLQALDKALRRMASAYDA